MRKKLSLKRVVIPDQFWIVSRTRAQPFSFYFLLLMLRDLLRSDACAYSQCDVKTESKMGMAERMTLKRVKRRQNGLKTKK